ncbi:interleukin-20 receptor subunit alpha-like [Lithobates pipiens]
MMLRILLLLLILLLSASANQCEFLKPRTVSFYSLDMNTTLTWMPPENAEGVFYTVTYLVYGSDIWHRKLECTNITWTWCNLAHETNKNSITYGKVTASNLNCSISEISEGFEPHHQTILGPPKINLFSTETSIVINLTHPIVDHFHIKFKYHIYLNGIHIKETETPYYKKEHLDSHTKYCITAKLSVFGRESSMSETTCITTEKDYSEQIIEVLQYSLPVILATLTFILVAYAVNKYIHVNNSSRPHSLNIMRRNNANVLFLESYSVPINILIIDRDIIKLQGSIISEKDESLNKSFMNLSLPEDYLIHESDITDEDNYYGYDTFEDNVQTSRPNISSYDMPHWTFDIPATNQKA